MSWITFDCFGTLVDWQSGFTNILLPLVGERTPDVLSAYHRFETQLEAEKPHRRYRDVLVAGLLRAAGAVGVPLSAAQASRLPDSWETLPVFHDTEPMLTDLRGLGYRLAVLTNCDEDLFADTHRSFSQPFDLVITAERVQDYKPSLAHFRSFARISGASLENWIHVACSWYHDIAPARELGVRRIWLDRELTGEDPTTASAHVRSAGEVREAVLGLQTPKRRTLFGTG
jgi:2-haloacid dehalogenase